MIAQLPGVFDKSRRGRRRRVPDGLLSCRNWALKPCRCKSRPRRYDHLRRTATSKAQGRLPRCSQQKSCAPNLVAVLEPNTPPCPNRRPGRRRGRRWRRARPARVVRATAPVKREPTMLSKIRVCADGDLALGMHGGKPRGDAGAGRRAVDLGLGEDADIPGRLLGERIVAIGQDRAVEEGEVGVVGMREREFGLERVRQRASPHRRSRARGRGRKPARTAGNRPAHRRRRHRPCRNVISP